MPRAICCIEDCGAPAVGRGFCRRHYTRWDRYGDPLFVSPQPVRGECRMDGCSRPHKAQGLCQTHYRRVQRYGSPDIVQRRRVAGTVEDRWWARVATGSGCWEWTGRRSPLGYGQFAIGQKGHNAYRWGYERFIGPVPVGLELDHLCRNPACVRFDHLEPVTHAENVRRGDAPEATRQRHARARLPA